MTTELHQVCAEVPEEQWQVVDEPERTEST
jgi:hypothetical protein